MALISKKISNHSSGLERELKVIGFTVNDFFKEVKFTYKITHSINGNPIEFKIPNKTWKIDNKYDAIVRDEEFKPIINKDYKPEYEVIETKWGENGEEKIYGDKIINEDDKFLHKPAYDYFKEITFDNEQPISIHMLLDYYIQDNDDKGFFNFY